MAWTPSSFNSHNQEVAMMPYNQNDVPMTMEMYMGMQERVGYHHEARIGTFRTEVKFKKTGQEISESVGKVVNKSVGKIEDVKASIAEICKKRELDPKEVIDAGSDEVAIETYSTKATTNMGPSRTNVLIRELQDDLNSLRRYGMLVESFNQDIENLQRIQTNIEKTREFDLSYTELVNFGF